MNSNVNTNIDFGRNDSNTSTSNSIAFSPNDVTPLYTGNKNQNTNIQTESMDLSFATEQVATESKSLLDKIGDFFSDIGEGLKNTGAKLVEGTKTAANWVINGIKELGPNIKEACTNLASNVKSILGSALTWAKDTAISLVSTMAIISTTVVSGLADIVEGIVVDGLTWCGGKVVEGASWLVGKVAGWFSNDAEESIMEWRAQAKTDIKEFIGTDWIGEFNDWLYQDTAVGKFINENSYLKYDSEAMQKLRGASEALGKLVLATAATIITGGAAAPLALGLLFGIGDQAEKMYQENLDTTGAQELGIFISGLGEAANWYAQGQLGSAGLKFLNVLKSTGIKNTGAIALSGFKSTIGNVKNNGFINTLKGIVKNSNWGSLMAKDNLADSAGIVADNISDWLVGNEELNIKTYMRAGGELFAAWTLNMFFDGASQYLEGLSKKIVHTDIDIVGPYEAQLAAFKDGSYAKFGTTDLPEEAVMSELWQIYMYDEDELAALAKIEDVFGPNSIQAETARGTLVQEMMGQHSYSTAYPADVARRVDEVYSAIGHKSRDLTTDFLSPGVSGTRTAESICQQHFASDYAFWKQAEATGANGGMRAYTGSNYCTMNLAMRTGESSASGSLISELSGQLNSLPGMQERTILYRGLDNLNWIADGALRGKYGDDLVDAINSLGGGVYAVGDNAFASSTPIMGKGFTGYKGIIEVTSCPTGTKGSYIGDLSTISHEVEYLLQAGESNRKVILGAEKIGSQIFVYTEIVPRQ